MNCPHKFFQNSILMLGLCMCYLAGLSQETPPILSKTAKDSIILNTAQFFQDHYVFPEKGMAISQGLSQKNAQGLFDEYSTALTFRKALQVAIREIVDDKHIIVIYTGPKTREEAPKSSGLQAEFERRKAANFGINEIKVLENNIGYININKFTSPELFGAKMSAASRFLAHVDGLVLDLRSRGGGNSYTVQLLLSYFLPPKVHLLNWYVRDTDEVEENWTLPYVPGKRFLDIPVVILTSKKTFSGSELFPYVMKHHGRATIIGEVTRGGAHTYKEMFPSEEFLVLVPYGRAVNAITNDNWEAKGVIPHLEVPADSALEKGLEFLQRRLKNNGK